MPALNGFLALGTMNASGVFTEISGAASYARQAITLQSASYGEMRNTNAIAFPKNSGAEWPAYDAYAVYDKVTGGSLQFAWRVAQERGIYAGNRPRTISPGNITIDFPVAISNDGSEVVLSKPFLWTPGGLQKADEAPITPTGSSVARPLGDILGSVQHPGLYNFKPSNLKKWRKALGGVRTSTGTGSLAMIGSSSITGQGTGTGTSIAGAAPRAFTALLPSIFSGFGVSAHRNSFWGSQTGIAADGYDPRIVQGAGWTINANATIGGPWLTNSTTTNALAFTPTDPIDTIEVWYIKEAGRGDFTIDVDGGAALLTVTQSGAFSVAKATATASLGNHTINIKRTGAGTSLGIIGVHAYNSTKKQLSVMNMGWSGSTAQGWNASSTAYHPLAMLGTLAPDLTGIMLGLNDLSGGHSVATFTTNMQAIIDRARASGDVFLLVPQPTASSFLSSALYADLVSAVYALAQANDCPVVDLSQRLVSYTDGNAAGLYYDTVHMNALAHGDIAQLVAKALMI